VGQWLDREACSLSLAAEDRGEEQCVDCAIDRRVDAVCRTLHDSREEAVYVSQVADGISLAVQIMHLIAKVQKSFEGVAQSTAPQKVGDVFNLAQRSPCR
jgi:hypothetical protein